jgi:hypothetical protein
LRTTSAPVQLVDDCCAVGRRRREGASQKAKVKRQKSKIKQESSTPLTYISFSDDEGGCSRANDRG